jgi:hypothetical protein
VAGRDSRVELVDRRTGERTTLSTDVGARWQWGAAMLSELGALPSDPTELEGTWRVTLPATDLATMLDEGMADYVGQPPIPGIMDGLAADLAGEYRITFDHGRFDAYRSDVDEPACTGSYLIRGNRAWLSSERGGRCTPGKLLEADFDVSGDELTFERDGQRSDFLWSIVLASIPLRRDA